MGGDPTRVKRERKITTRKEAKANRRKVQDALKERASTLQQANQELLAEKKIFQMTLACIMNRHARDIHKQEQPSHDSSRPAGLM
jgi:hypothetical protein